MSFILDALRKSESERQREVAPTLMRASYAPPKRPVPAWTWALIGLLSVALLAVGITSWLGSRGSEVMQPASSPAVGLGTEPAAEPATASPFPAPTAGSVRETSTLPEPDLSAPPRTIDELRTMNPNLPEYRLEFVAFDSNDPAGSSAWINGRRRYPGDAIGDGVALAEVRQSGVLLTYAGEVFLLRL